MTVRKIDENNDWTFGAGKQNYIKNSAEVMQNILTKLQVWKGECFFAKDQGVNYNAHLRKGNNSVLEEDIRRVIVQTYGVAELSIFSYDLDEKTRELSVKYTVVDIFGQTWEQTIKSLGEYNA